VKILVLIPVKKNISPQLDRLAQIQSNRLPEANPYHWVTVVLDRRGPGDNMGVPGGCFPQPSRAQSLARLRQAMVDDYLKDNDFVLWIDADISEYPADLPSRLVERCGGGIAAPLVLHAPSVNPSGQFTESDFYDTLGFKENGGKARNKPPWFDQPGPVYDLTSVGCVYLVPRAVYDAGGRHDFILGETEHYSVCQKAREMGLPVRAFDDLRAYHAYLPDYGECWHG
jgi:hypothetical protein